MIENSHSKATIEQIATMWKFDSARNVEKLMMDFHIHKLITQELGGVLRGGMCMPFYTNKIGAARLSVDVDIFVKKSRKTVEATIQKIANEHKYKATFHKEHDRIDNLLQCSIKYETKLHEHNQKDYIKLDIIHDTEIELPQITIPKGYKLFIGDTMHDIVVMTRGGLLADKITSLAYGSIGYAETRKEAASKQIYDISVLLRNAESKDILEAFTLYKKIAQFKIKHYAGTITYERVLEQIETFLKKQLDLTKSIELSDEHKVSSEEFEDRYLSKKHKYGTVQKKLDILKTHLYASCIKAIEEGRITIEYATKVINECTIDSQVNPFLQQKNPKIKKSVLEKIPDGFSHELLLKEPLQNLVLLQKILEINELES